ncbi:MAG TPA: hypothetical protein VGG10_03715 [Rhizomicrobium sp.]
MNNTKAWTIGKFAFVAVALALLSGCATAANPGAMTVMAQAADQPFPAKLQHAMCVRTVSGGEETNPLWTSKVDNNGFKTALDGSLSGAGLLSSGSCAYPIDVNLLGLSQPIMGFDMTVTSHVNYKVYDSSGQPFLLSTIDAPYTAKMGDAFVGVERLRLANEGSIRESIQMFFDKLRASQPK